MKRFLSTTGVVIALAFSGVACDKIKPPQPQLQKPPAPSDQVSQGEHEAYSQAAQKELDGLRNVIAELKAKVASANQQTKVQLGEEIEKLETKLRETQQQLMALKSGTVESWTQLKISFVKSLEQLKSGIENYRKNAT
jgi:septal ring factor EnvC (AmiA/AmiB activator)